jgi:hypothetical protein
MGLEQTQRIHIEDDGAIGDLFFGAEIEDASERIMQRSAPRRFQQELKPVLAFQTGHGRSGGAQGTNSTFFEWREIFGELARPANGILHFAISHQHSCQSCERWLMHQPSKPHFALEKPLKVLPRGILNRKMLRIETFH